MNTDRVLVAGCLNWEAEGRNRFNVEVLSLSFGDKYIKGRKREDGVD